MPRHNTQRAYHLERVVVLAGHDCLGGRGQLALILDGIASLHDGAEQGVDGHVFLVWILVGVEQQTALVSDIGEESERE